MAHAKTLGNSVSRWCPDVDFYILLSDKAEGFDTRSEGYTVIQSSNLGIPDFAEMAFKYDVIEFSTSIKPFFIDTLIKDKGYEKVLYLDPDMVVYNSLDFLFNNLDACDALITPHINKPYVVYEGATSEEELLFVGIYNLGFFGINSSETAKNIIEWWKVKLKDQCFADKEDALHVDQKWMDFLPALYGDRISIVRHPGVNLAFWNMHERSFLDENANYFVDGERLLIFHFSGLDPHLYCEIARKQSKYTLHNMPQYSRLFKEYVQQLNYNGFEYYSSLPYSYNLYENGVYILKYHRRLFRALLQDKVFTNPFSTSNGSFYELLVANNLMIYDRTGKFVAIRKGITNVDNKIEKAFRFLKLFQRIIGIKRYYLLMRFLSTHSRFEKQIFLLKRDS